jgi:hypothetical protein
MHHICLGFRFSNCGCRPLRYQCKIRAGMMSCDPKHPSRVWWMPKIAQSQAAKLCQDLSFHTRKPIRSGKEFVSDNSRTMRSLAKPRYYWMHRVLCSECHGLVELMTEKYSLPPIEARLVFCLVHRTSGSGAEHVLVASEALSGYHG